jgi:hypothetical protein
MFLSFDNESVVLLAMIFVSIFLIYKMYNSEVKGKNIIVTIYLYIFVALLAITYFGKIAAKMSITDQENMWKLITAYFIFGFTGIFMMVSDNLYLTHLGYVLLILAIGLTIGVYRKYSKNLLNALIGTCIMVAILTTVVFYSSEETMEKMKSWLPNLMMLLFIVIVIQICYLLFFQKNEVFYKLLAASVIILFGFFVLSDTSRVIKDARQIDCNNHYCINYPLKSSSLLLDYLNVFVNMASFNQ